MAAWTFTRARACEPPIGVTHLQFLEEGFCTHCGLYPDERTAPLTIAAERWFDARTVAFDTFHTTELQCAEAREKDAEIRVRWSGHAYGRVPTLERVVEAVKKTRRKKK